MNVEALLIMLAIGALCGWLAGVIFKGYGFGLFGNIVIGILGSFVGSYVFKALGVSLGGGLAANILSSVVGAGIILFLVGLFKKA